MGSTEEFIGLYDKLCDFFHHVTDSETSTSFNELVDKAAVSNGVVKKEASLLKDFGGLGSAMKIRQGYQLAKPTKDALSKFKYLVDSIISPKSLIPTFQTKIRCFSPNDQLLTALKYMGENDFSQVVISDKGKVLLLTAEGVAKWLELQAEKDVIRLSKVKLKDALACDLPNTFVVIGPENTSYDAKQIFKDSIEKMHPRLFAIIITDSGKRTGQPIGIVTPWDLQPEETPTEDYVFRRQEDFWNIVFEGESILLRNTKGLQYIYYLLQRPHEDFLASTLESAAKGPHGDPTAKMYDKMSTEQAEQYGLSISHGQGNAGPVLDPRAISEYKEYYQSLVEELEEAEGSGDPERVALLKDQIGHISAQLKSARGLGGKARKSADDRERARKAVTNRIKDSLKKIQKQHRTLGLHLSKAIETGTFCSYNPEKPISWDF
jgi:hypothetical protein